MPVYDPALYTDQMSELPAEVELLIMVLDIMKDLRKTLGSKLPSANLTWMLPETYALIQQSIVAGTPLAGHAAADWHKWGVVFAQLNVWLNTPIEEIGGATPLQVVMKRYTQIVEQPESLPMP